MVAASGGKHTCQQQRGEHGQCKEGSGGGRRARTGAELKPLYMEALTLVERLHRRLLDVIKDEFDRSGRSDVNSVQALLLFNIGEFGADRRRAAHARLLSRLERLLQSQEAGRDGLHPSPALAHGPPLGPRQPDREGPARSPKIVNAPLRAAHPLDRPGRRHRGRRFPRCSTARCSGSSASGPTRSSTGSEPIFRDRTAESPASAGLLSRCGDRRSRHDSATLQPPDRPRNSPSRRHSIGKIRASMPGSWAGQTLSLRRAAC